MDRLSDYPLKPHPYQVEAFESCKLSNVIVNIPTGAGKTFIAILVIDHYLQLYPKKNIIFSVPTVVLVKQQAEYVKSMSLEKPIVIELCGNTTDSWTDYDWRKCLKSNRVLVGTPEVFKRALFAKYIDIDSISLLIFDECHNVTGNSPPAAIMRDIIHPIGLHLQPRILGLTASFVNGSMKNIEGKRKTLEELMCSQIFAPDVNEYMKQKNFNEVLYENVEIDEDDIIIFVSEVLDNLISSFYDILSFKKNNIEKVVRWGTHVLTQLGLQGFVYFITNSLVKQLDENIQKTLANTTFFNVDKIQNQLIKLEKHLKANEGNVIQKCNNSNFPIITVKCKTLLDLLGQQVTDCNETTRGLVFVEQICLSYPLSHIINSHFNQNNNNNNNNNNSHNNISAPISGGLTISKRNEYMEKFRNNELSILVTTTALEEGIDVPQCKFVIRFDCFATTKSHIQGSGRARYDGADIYYFENRIEKEKRNAEEMQRVAREESLKVSKEEMEDNLIKDAILKASGKDKYPFYHPHSEALLDHSNCIPLFHEYIQKVMKQAAPQENIYNFKNEVINQKSKEVVKTLISVSYPSPEGIQEVTLDMVNEHWGDLSLKDIIHKDGQKNLKNVDLQKRSFVYVVMKELFFKGYLNGDFSSSLIAQQKTKPVCEAYIIVGGMKFTQKYTL